MSAIGFVFITMAPLYIGNLILPVFLIKPLSKNLSAPLNGRGVPAMGSRLRPGGSSEDDDHFNKLPTF